METTVNQVKQTICNKDDNCIVCENSIDIEDSIIETLSDLYKHGLKEFGRCTGKVYIDREGQAKHIGYVFEKRAKYTDCNETYMQETWLSIERYTETRTRRYND